MTIANAQFYSSETVYIYKYDHTENDGIKSKKGTEYYIWVNFQNDMMGQIMESDISRIRRNMLDNPSYYDDKARNDLASHYNEYKSRPSFFGSALASVWLWKYCDDLSTGSKTTYRQMSANAKSDWNTSTAWWGELKWQNRCFTFSNDKSELIEWNMNNSEKRDYYKRISASDLKPNTDFLY